MAKRNLSDWTFSELLRRLAQLLGLVLIAACSEQAVERPEASLRASVHQFSFLAEAPVPALSTIAAVVEERDPDQGDGAMGERVDEARDRLHHSPYVCEQFEMRVRDDGRARHKRLRRSWTEADRQRFRKLVEMVAKEMGADPKLVALWALRESTYNPYAIHVLDPDLEASSQSWRRHRWDPERAEELHAIMAEVGARDPGYWKAKAELSRISRFKDNPYYEDRVSFDVVLPKGERERGETSYWGYGYGPFGFNPTYFLATWDAKAPPWVFCNDDGIAAIVTAVWAARQHQRECASLGFGDGNEVVNRRFSSGHCELRPGRAHLFRKRARARNINPSATAKLGDRWPMDSSDRRAIVDHMRTRAEAEGLLSRHARADAAQLRH